jgi:acyl-homoserine lactone acylase PvdQ/plastocyanin
MMGLMLTDTSSEEIVRGALASMVEPMYSSAGLPGMTEFLMPTGWVNMTTIMPPAYSSASSAGLTSFAAIEAITAPLQRLLGFAGLGGSNNWVIDDLNTTTGHAMLANDPHLDLQTPGINWQVHINVPGYTNTIGCCIPGGAAIYTGHNDYFAFGVTNLMADILDLYYYVSNATHYFYVDHWEPFKTDIITIYNLTQPVQIPVVSTRHGPLISTPLPPPFDRMAFRWGGKESGYGEMTGFSLLMNATGLSDWKKALSHMSVIVQNYVYADKNGNIAWCPSGKIPLRPPPPPTGTGTLGAVPSNGSAGQNEWMGWLPHASAPVDYDFDPWPGPVSMPYSENPKQGFIATSNNQPVDPTCFGYPWPIWIGPACGFDPGYRGQRITELIETLQPIDVNDMKIIQADSLCIPARNIVPILLEALAKDTNATIQNALALLRNWNYTELRNMTAPLIWEAFMEKFTDNTFGDEQWASMGLYPFPNTIIPLWNMTQTWNWNPYAIALFDDQNTLETETMPEIMNKSLHDALDWITKQLGPPADANLSNWKYGDLHVVDFGHPMGSQLAFLNVPTTPVGCDGGPYTVDPGGHYHKLVVKDVLYVETGSSYRGIYECKDGWETSLILVPPGESGLVTGFPIPDLCTFSPHYSDTFYMWLDNEYTSCLFKDATIKTYAKTTFVPIVTISLFGSATAGWGPTQDNITSPGPTITVDAGSLVNLTLTSADGIKHNFFVDYDNDANPSTGEPKAPDFQTTTINLQFEAHTTGNFTYYCEYHKGTMNGTFQVQTTLATDIDGNGIVNIVDIAKVAKAFGSKPGDSNWNPIADLNSDNQVNIVDVALVAKDYGKTV